MARRTPAKSTCRSEDIPTSACTCISCTSLMTDRMSILKLPSLTSSTACLISATLREISTAILLSLMAARTGERSTSGCRSTRFLTSLSACRTGEKSTSTLFASTAFAAAKESTAALHSQMALWTPDIFPYTSDWICLTSSMTGDKSNLNLPSAIAARPCLISTMPVEESKAALLSLMLAMTGEKSTSGLCSLIVLTTSEKSTCLFNS
mmetsp:Transcript_128952/g.359040  ORF Transcript_128952/g.359040 Transcript_128952/m.359040 type:complete len:208 (+) Transcript_128952:455-1078(+)